MIFARYTLRAACILGLALAGLPLSNSVAQDRARSRVSVEPFVEDAAPSAFATQGKLLDYRSDAIQPEWQQNPRTRTAARPQSTNRTYAARQASYAEPREGEIIYEDGAEHIGTPHSSRSPVRRGRVDGYDHFDMASDGCDSCGPAGCSDGCASDGCCSSGGCTMPWHRWGGCVCITPYLDEFSIFAGPQGFKSPVDGGQNGNFGFHQGAQIGAPLFEGLGIGYQLGVQAVQSNLSGFLVGNPDDGTREQVFVTGGLFHRAFCGYGFQYGIVYDYLSDNYYTDFELAQIRGEISFIGRCGNEFGFWGTAGTNNDTVPIVGARTLTFEPTDIYAFFYRRNICGGGEGRVWGGATSNGDGIFGADFRVPLTNRWDLTGGFNYKIPQEDGLAGASEEAFAIGMNLVWYPGRCPQGKHNGPWRPLLNVADNGTFMVEMADNN